jgi:hypothetical protein
MSTSSASNTCGLGLSIAEIIHKGNDTLLRFI